MEVTWVFLLPYKSVTWVSSNPTVNTPEKPNMTLENLKGDLILLMDKIRLTSWYGTYFHDITRVLYIQMLVIARFLNHQQYVTFREGSKHTISNQWFSGGMLIFRWLNMTGDLKGPPVGCTPFQNPNWEAAQLEFVVSRCPGSQGFALGALECQMLDDSMASWCQLTLKLC